MLKKDTKQVTCTKPIVAKHSGQWGLPECSFEPGDQGVIRGYSFDGIDRHYTVEFRKHGLSWFAVIPQRLMKEVKRGQEKG